MPKVSEMTDKKQYDLDTIRHSTAHVMAQAITELFPNENVKLGIGPTIEHGFYYDIDLDVKLQDEDLKKIENKMKEIIKKSLPVRRHEISRDDAIKLFTSKNQDLKVELIKDLPASEVITYYSHGEDDFIDLCRGPHVETTKELPHFFKLTNTAGAYWRGNVDRKMLQRVYAVCFLSKEELKDHLTFLEEAKKRDHRKLGKELEYFHFDPIAPGSPFIMPKGTRVYNELTQFVRRLYGHYGYDEVITPQLLDVNLWKTSGHYDNYKDDMFFVEVDERQFAMKPMNCPCHMMMFKHYRYSYKDLPLRFADFGRLHRNEKSGTLAGLTRVRTFCQDDAHIFLPADKIQDEIKNLMEMFFICYRHFDFKNIRVNLSTRPDKKIGDDKIWDQSESALKEALKLGTYDYNLKEGDGAFYGPKIDIEIADAIGRWHQLGTIQLDFMLPERFDLSFTNQAGEQERPVVIHRALLGSLERFLGVYMEHVTGAFPFWLAPEQITLIPVNNEFHLDYARKIQAQLSALGYRCSIDDRNESLGKKTRETQKTKIPFMAVIGDKEVEAQLIALRKYGEQETQTLPMQEALDLFEKLNAEKVPQELREFIRV